MSTTVYTSGGSPKTRSSITRTVTADETVSDDAEVVYLLVDASGGAVTLTLPAVATRAGREIVITKTDSSGFTVTADGNASETINGDTTLIINYQWSSANLFCTGSEWIIT